MSKIKLTSVVPYTISWYYPDYRINNLFSPNKRTFFVEEDVLKELLFYPGVKGCIMNGEITLSDEDRIKVGLGSENPEEDKELKPKILTEKEIENILTTAKYGEFKKVIDELPGAQIGRVVAYAIEHKLTDYAKCNYLKKLSGTDIQEAVKLNDESEEE